MLNTSDFPLGETSQLIKEIFLYIHDVPGAMLMADIVGNKMRHSVTSSSCPCVVTPHWLSWDSNWGSL